MKKLILLPLAILMIAACSNDERLSSTQKKEIAVRPLVQNSTRGEAVTLANLDAFRVWGINADAEKPAIEGNFTDIVRPSGDGSTWDMDGKHFWMTDPVSGNPFYGDNVVNFTGLYPKDMIATATPPETFPLNLNNPNGRSLDDIIVAYFSGTRDDNIASGVPLNFKHVLSQIIVRAANGHTDERKVEIIGVKLCNVKREATLTLPTVNTNGAAAYAPISNVSGDAQSYIIKHKDSQAPVTLTAEPQNIMFDLTSNSSGFMVIPQTFSCELLPVDLKATDTYLGILCRLYSKDDNGNWELIYPKNGKDGQYAFTAIGISGKWEPGKRYIYTLNFYEGSGGAGIIAPDTTDPDDPKNPEVDTTPDDPDNPTGYPDDEQAKTPITFTVTVEDWLNGTGTIDDFNKIM